MKKNNKQIIEMEFDKNSIFFTSDTHFGSHSIAKERGFKHLREMEDTLVKNWNNVVKDDQFVIIAGDFCFGSASECANILQRLNGHKILVAGNHDEELLKQKKLEGFTLICKEMNVTINGQKFNVRHEPSKEWNSQDTIQLYGHFHQKDYDRIIDVFQIPQYGKNRYDVGVDNNNFTPVSYDKIINRLEERASAVFTDVYFYKDNHYHAVCPALGLDTFASSMGNSLIAMNETIQLFLKYSENLLGKLQALGWNFKEGITPPTINRTNNQLIKELENEHYNRIILSVPILLPKDLLTI